MLDSSRPFLPSAPARGALFRPATPPRERPARFRSRSACPRKAQALVDAGRDRSVAEIARSFGRRAGFFARILRLNYLAPDIIAAILDGTQPPGLTRKKLVKANLPMDWALQR